MQVERVDAAVVNPLSLDPVMLAASGLTEEMLVKFNRPLLACEHRNAKGAEPVTETVVFATELAKRLARSGDGVVMDVCARLPRLADRVLRPSSEAIGRGLGLMNFNGLQLATIADLESIVESIQHGDEADHKGQLDDFWLAEHLPELIEKALRDPIGINRHLLGVG